MKPILKIGFDFFWKDFNPEDNYFTRVLEKKYTLELSEKPELFFFTHCYAGSRRAYLKHSCHRVFLGWENMRADWNISDYVLDSDYYPGNPRHKRWPIWAAWDTGKLVQPKTALPYLQKKKFACMVVSNGKARERIDFFHKLSKYKPVDSGGRFLNNVGGPVANKMDFIRDYKFVISFENSSFPGYTTEKLIEPMLVNSLPIYWGNERVGDDFNTGSFVHVNSFTSFDDTIERIIELDRSEEKYLELAMQPWFHHNTVPPQMTPDGLETFFDFVLDDMKTRIPVASSFTKRNLHRARLLKETIQGKVYGKLGIKRGFR